MLMATCRCGPRPQHFSGYIADAKRAARFDPTGTLDIRAAFRRQMDSRWSKLRRLALEAIDRNDMLGLAGVTHRSIMVASQTISVEQIYPGSDKVKAFQSWIDAAMSQVILGDVYGSWTSQFINRTAERAIERAAELTGRKIGDADWDEKKHPRKAKGSGEEGGEFTFREAGQNIGVEELAKLTKPGHFYRGMSAAEYEATIGSGKGISSNLSASIASAEGTNFSEDVPTAESYANFGRTDPRVTGQANYLVEVRGGKDIVIKPDGYYHAKTEVPRSRITRVWRMENKNGAIVARRVSLRDSINDSLDQYRVQALVSLTVVELQGVMEAVSQQAVRAFTQGMLSKQRPSQVARSVSAVINAIGTVRGRMVVSTMIVKTFTAVTADAFRSAGITRIGTIPERIRVVRGPNGNIKLAKDAARTTPQKRGRGGKFKAFTPKPTARQLAAILKAEEKLQALGEVDILNADDPCPICEELSSAGPYSIDEAESLIPQHPNCLCSLIPVSDERFAEVEKD